MQAEKELRAQKLGWLRLESVHRILQEMVLEYRFRQHHDRVGPAEDTVGDYNRCVINKNAYSINKKVLQFTASQNSRLIS